MARAGSASPAMPCSVSSHAMGQRMEHAAERAGRGAEGAWQAAGAGLRAHGRRRELRARERAEDGAGAEGLAGTPAERAKWG